MGIAVYEIKLKIYTLVDIPTEQLLGKRSSIYRFCFGVGRSVDKISRR